MQSQRQTAYKLWISDIIRGKYSRDEGEFGLNYVLVGDKKVSRINLIGTFVDFYRNENGSYVAALLDDGSGAIRCKNWNEDINLYNNVGIGSIVLIVGKLREQDGEVYIIPEIVKSVDPAWAKVRILELNKKYGKPERIEFETDVKNPEIVEEIVSGSDRHRILNLIEKYDSTNGIDYDELILKSGLKEDAVKEIVVDLLKSGELFEPKPGKLKLLG